MSCERTRVPNARKAVLRESCALIAATAGAFDLKRRARPDVDRIDLADTRGIERMRLRKVETRAVKFRETATARLDLQAGRLDRFEECPAGRIDSGRVLERTLQLRPDACKTRRILREKDLD